MTNDLVQWLLDSELAGSMMLLYEILLYSTVKSLCPSDAVFVPKTSFSEHPENISHSLVAARLQKHVAFWFFSVVNVKLLFTLERLVKMIAKNHI